MNAEQPSPYSPGLDPHGDDASTSLRGGPGAPIFEPGPHTRIRRNPVRAIATLTWSGGPREIFGQVVNVSPGGLLVKTESTIAEGTQVEMTITVLGRDRRLKVDVTAIVRRETVCEGRRAYGVEFLTENSADRQTLQLLYAEASR